MFFGIFSKGFQLNSLGEGFVVKSQIYPSIVKLLIGSSDCFSEELFGNIRGGSLVNITKLRKRMHWGLARVPGNLDIVHCEFCGGEVAMFVD